MSGEEECKWIGVSGSKRVWDVLSFPPGCVIMI